MNHFTHILHLFSLSRILDTRYHQSQFHQITGAQISF